MNISDFFESNGERINKSKKEHVFKQGDMDGNLYFIQSGLLKAYYLTFDGKEFVKSFLLPGDIIGSLRASHTNEPSSFNLLCLESSQLIKLKFEQLYQAALKDTEMTEVVFELLINLALKKERREFEFLCCTPEQRYALLKERTPLLLEKVTQTDIAKYIGITAVALSRIINRSKA